MEHQEAYQRARKRVEAKIGFFIHLAVYVVVIVMLMIINLTSSAQYLWFKWPLIGWGIGVAFHGLAVFVFADRSIITDQMIDREMKRQADKDLQG